MEKLSRTRSIYQLLGLARRAGAVAPGTEAVRGAIRIGKAYVILMAKDASQSQMQKIQRTLRGRTVRQANLGDRCTLGAAVGLSALSALAVTSESLAEQVLAELACSGTAEG